MEVHGRLGLYKCTQSRCQYSKVVTISPDAFPEETKEALAGSNGARITKHNVPRCPNCDSVSEKTAVNDSWLTWLR